jgi:two-component system, sensor histidine kinase LadS
MQLTVPRLFHTVVLTLVVWAAHCLPAQVANAADPIEITAIEYLLAPNSESFRTVAEPSFAPLWQTSDQPTLNMGYRPEGAWVRFHITNHAANEVKRLLLVDWSFTLIEARILNTARGEWSSAVHTGDSVAPHKRDVNSPIQVLPLSLPPDEAEVYLRLEATAPMLLPFRLLAPSELPKAERDNNLLMSAFFGAMLVMMLYNASLFIFTRDAAYLFYCAYVLSGAFYVASIFSFGPYFLWWDSPWLVSRATVLSVSLGFFGAALFERQFLELRRQGGWLLHLSHVVLGYWLCAALVSAFAPQAIGYVRIEHGGSLTCVAAIVIAVVCWGVAVSPPATSWWPGQDWYALPWASPWQWPG